MKMLRMLKSNLLKYKIYLTAFIFFNLLSLAASLIIPYLTGKYIDILNYKNKNFTLFLIKILAIILVVEIIVTYFKNVISIKYKTRISFDINFKAIEHIKRVPLSYINNENTTYLNSKINFDSDIVTFFVIDNGILIIFKVITFIFSLFIMLKTNYKTSLILLSLLPLYILAYYKFKKPLYKNGIKFKEDQSKLFALVNDQLGKIKLLKINSLFEIFSQELKKGFNFLFESAIGYAKTSILVSNIDLTLNRFSTLILFTYGGMQVLNSKLSIGNFLIINSYFTLLLGCTSYFLDFGKSYQNALVSYNRLKAIFDIEKEPIGNEVIKNINNITLKNVTFSYSKNKHILDNFNYKFEKNKIYSIIGENGIGKSTLIDLIIGLRNDYIGEIYYNSTNIKDLNLYSIREKLIGFTEQEPTLINNTLINNLTLNCDKCDTQSINLLIDKVNLKEFIENLPDGLNTNIKGNCNNLSGGEKQKISILRSIFKGPDIFIFDEPTSALDIITIEKLKALFQELKTDKIIIIITHNYDFLSISDEIIDFSSIKNNLLTG